MTSLSIVIPIKDERDNLEPLLERIDRALQGQGSPIEILFVDDGSSDGSLAVLERLAAADARVRVVSLRRNFGQTAALQAGIDYASGNVIVTMDGDLQNDPADIPRLLERLAEGYDAVLGLRQRRHDALLVRKIPSRLGNWLIRKVTGVPIQDMGCTLRAMRRELAQALPLYGELHRFIPVLARQYGAQLMQIPVRHHPRTAGKTKYNLSRTIRVVLDLITVMFLHRYMTRPMHFMGIAGLGSMALGLLALLTTLWMKSAYGIFMTGNPILHLSIMLEMIGIQFISMGLLAEVLVRTYFESQGKPAYLVRRTVNLEEPGRRRAA